MNRRPVYIAFPNPHLPAFIDYAVECIKNSVNSNELPHLHPSFIAALKKINLEAALEQALFREVYDRSIQPTEQPETLVIYHDFGVWPFMSDCQSYYPSYALRKLDSPILQRIQEQHHVEDPPPSHPFASIC
jgi:hypothetical protein